MKARCLWTTVGLLLAVALMTASTGCKRGGTTTTVVVPPPGPAVAAAPALPCELTYPQSDDQGHYVALKKNGSYVVSGIVASPQPPTRVLVNGISTQPYGVEYISPYGVDSGYPSYRFHAPVVMAPTDQIVVQVVEPVMSREVIFLPDGPAVVTRYTTMVTERPTDPWRQHRLANAYYAQDDYSNSLTYLNRALTIDKKSPWILFDLGMTYLSLQRAREAEDYFHRSIVIYPSFPDPYYGRGTVYYSTRRYDGAIVDLVKASHIAPSWAEPLLALGLVYYADRRLSDAQGTFYRSAEVWPYWPAPRYALANVLLDRGDMKNGLVVLAGAERLGPWRYEHHMELARKLYAKGNTNAAWRQVQIARAQGGQVPGTFLKQLSSKGKDPGALREEPWKAMRGPGHKPEVTPAQVGGGQGHSKGGNGGQGHQGAGSGGGQGHSKGGNGGQGHQGAGSSGGGQSHQGAGSDGGQGHQGASGNGGNGGSGGSGGQGHQGAGSGGGQGQGNGGSKKHGGGGR